MRRRAYLTLAAALFAGCGRSGQPSETTTATETTGTETTETATTTRTTATTETESTTETETTTESTPTPDPDAAAALEDADAFIVDAVEKYGSYAGEGATFLGVTAATKDFATGAITRSVADARDALDAAEETGTERQRRTVERLREAATFVVSAAAAQHDLGRRYADYRVAFELVYIDEYSDDRVEKVRDAYDAAAPSLARIAERTSTASADATSAYTGDEYERKREQVRAEVRTYELAGDHFGAFDDARESLAAAVSAYDDQRWGRAADRFGALAETYGAMASDIGDHEAPPPLDREFAVFACDVRALARGCERLEASATLRSEGKRSEAVAARDESRAAFEECGTLDRLDVLKRVY